MRRYAFWLATSLAFATPALAQEGVLPRSTPEKQGVASSALLEFVEAADRDIDTMNSFMLVRHGHVVAEGWWTPYDAKTRHILYSLSKSFTSTAVGLAIAEGKLSVNDEVLKFFPDEAPESPSANLKSMRVRDLLRMSAGNQTEASLWRVDPKSEKRDWTWTKRFLAHAVPFKPGTHFMYNSPATYMLSAIVQKVTGQAVVDYLQPRLFDPLGIKKPAWVASPEGVSAGAYGLSVRTEDIAKFGQLYLQKGQWHGKSLVPAAWVAEATALQTSNGSAPKSDWEQGYGYQFWRCRHNAFRGDGAFGQYCIVLPEQDAVVAITSGVRDMQAVLNLVWDKLLPALGDKPLGDDPAALKKLTDKLAGLTVKIPSGQSTSPLMAKTEGKSFEFPENDRGIQSVELDFAANLPSLVVRTDKGQSRTVFGIGAWSKPARGGFTSGAEDFLAVPEPPLVSASGAWTADDTFTIKLVLPETPFYTNLKLKLDGDRLLFDAEHHVAFGPTKLPQLVGKAANK